MSEGAVVALRGMGVKIVGELADALLDPRADFVVPPTDSANPRCLRLAAGRCGAAPGSRRRTVRGSVSERGRAFENPRSRSGHRNTGNPYSEDRQQGTGRRPPRLDKPDGWWILTVPILTTDYSKAGLDLSLTHVFRLLSLIFEKDPLRVALRGLHTDDPYLRGTALEYLENLLPTDIFSRLSGYLPEDGPLPATEAKPGTRSARGTDALATIHRDQSGEPQEKARVTSWQIAERFGDESAIITELR